MSQRPASLDSTVSTISAWWEYTTSEATAERDTLEIRMGAITGNIIKRLVEIPL